MEQQTLLTLSAIGFFLFAVLAMLWTIHKERKEFEEHEFEIPEETNYRGKNLYMTSEEFERFEKLPRQQKREIVKQTQIAIKKGTVKIVEDENGIRRLVPTGEYREVNNGKNS